jgi:hypothetical protein
VLTLPIGKRVPIEHSRRRPSTGSVLRQAQDDGARQSARPSSRAGALLDREKGCVLSRGRLSPTPGYTLRPLPGSAGLAEASLGGWGPGSVVAVMSSSSIGERPTCPPSPAILAGWRPARPGERVRPFQGSAFADPWLHSSTPIGVGLPR